MYNITRINHFFGQQTQEWHDLKAGKLSSSEIFNLFSEVPRIERCREVVKRIINKTDAFLWTKEANKIADNDYMNYVGKELQKQSVITKLDFNEAKKSLKAHLLGGDPMSRGAELILTSIQGVENIQMLGGASRTYIYSRAIEMIYGEQDINSGGIACEWGNDYEPIAAIRFKEKNLYAPDAPKISFCELEGMETGCSPDDTENFVNPSEYKCPYSKKVHLEHTSLKTPLELLNYSPQKYYQVLHQMWCLGAETGNWSSYDPRLENNEKAKHLSLHTIPFEQDENVFAQFESKIPMAVKQRDEMVLELLD